RDGVVIDPNMFKRRSGMRIKSVYRVLNAPEVPVGTIVRAVRAPSAARPRAWRAHCRSAYSQTAATLARFKEMHAYTATRSATVEQVLQNTSYTRGDLEYDLRLGHVRLDVE